MNEFYVIRILHNDEIYYIYDIDKYSVTESISKAYHASIEEYHKCIESIAATESFAKFDSKRIDIEYAKATVLCVTVYKCAFEFDVKNTCLFCKTSLIDDSKFCHKCGKPVTGIYKEIVHANLQSSI